MPEEKDQHGYPTTPRQIKSGDQEGWFYEQKEGLCVVLGGLNTVTGAAHITIPWQQVSRAIDRHRRVKAGWRRKHPKN